MGPLGLVDGDVISYGLAKALLLPFTHFWHLWTAAPCTCQKISHSTSHELCNDSGKIELHQPRGPLEVYNSACAQPTALGASSIEGDQLENEDIYSLGEEAHGEYYTTAAEVWAASTSCTTVELGGKASRTPSTCIKGEHPSSPVELRIGMDLCLSPSLLSFGLVLLPSGPWPLVWLL